MSRQESELPGGGPTLVGILVDVSGSMKDSIGNAAGESLNRLQAFEKSLGEFATRAREMVRTSGGGAVVQVFAYGFGFNNPLSAFLGRRGPNVRDLFAKYHSASTLVSVEQLADRWQDYRASVQSQALEMFGSTPMVQAFQKAAERVAKESALQSFGAKILFVLSDGEPTDGPAPQVASLAAKLASDGVLIVSCYVTDQDITAPRTLYNAIGANWPAGATLMFQCASALPKNSPFEAYLSEHHWSCPAGARLFTQVNQSEILAEFLGMLVGSIDSGARPVPQLRTSKRVFVSYSRKDQVWLDRIRVHLKPLERAGTWMSGATSG